MLDSLRSYATGWIAQLLMGILVLSFAVWGVNDVFTGYGSNDIAMVGSRAVTVAEFQRDYDLAVQNLGRQLGQTLTSEQARQAGIPSQILGRLINQATLDHAASKMGLGISNQALSHKIAADPQFFGNAGTFDRGYLTEIIRSQGLSENDFIVNRRREDARNQLAQAFAGGILAPASYVRAVHEYRSEERDVSYVIITAPAASEIGDPGEADLTAYYDTHKAEWTTPEVRAVSYFVLAPADVARTDEVTDDDAQKNYDAHKDRFATPEKRKVEQIVFKDRAEADQAVAGLTGGKTFDALMTERNLKPADVDLGLVTKDKIVDPAVADAAFGLALNAISPVVNGQFGPAILRVTSIEPAVITTFDQAKADLKKEIADQRAVAEIADTHDSIEDARAAGGTLAEIAGKYGLKVVAIPSIDGTGKDIDGNVVANVPTGLDAAALESDVGIENDPIQPDRNSFVWYEVTAVTAPRERPLAEVRDKVVTAWKDAERTKRTIAKADAIKTRIDSKEDLATITTDLGLEVKTAAKLTRLTKPAGDISTAALVAVFNGPKGAAVVANGAEPMTRLVLVTNEVTVPAFVDDAPDLADSRKALDGQFINAFLGLYVTELQSKTDVKFNQVALQQVLGATDTGN